MTLYLSQCREVALSQRLAHLLIDLQSLLCSTTTEMRMLFMAAK
jgi:hypothetical protein